MAEFYSGLSVNITPIHWWIIAPVFSLRDGAGLDQIGITLRHASHDTTAIYAKVDIGMLTDIAQPWPGVAS